MLPRKDIQSWAAYAGGMYIVQTQAGNSLEKSGFAQLKAMSFLKWVIGGRVSITTSRMLVVIQPKACVTAEAPIL